MDLEIGVLEVTAGYLSRRKGHDNRAEQFDIASFLAARHVIVFIPTSLAPIAEFHFACYIHYS